MKAIICVSCGASEFDIRNGFRICKYCGTKYDMYEPVSKSEGFKGIELNNDILRLLRKCRDDPKNSRKYANLILDIDPTNEEALKYL